MESAAEANNGPMRTPGPAGPATAGGTATRPAVSSLVTDGGKTGGVGAGFCLASCAGAGAGASFSSSRRKHACGDPADEGGGLSDGEGNGGDSGATGGGDWTTSSGAAATLGGTTDSAASTATPGAVLPCSNLRSSSEWDLAIALTPFGTVRGRLPLLLRCRLRASGASSGTAYSPAAWSTGAVEDAEGVG